MRSLALRASMERHEALQSPDSDSVVVPESLLISDIRI